MFSGVRKLIDYCYYKCTKAYASLGDSNPEIMGWGYDSHGNVTSDPVGSTTMAWNVLDMPRDISSGTAGVQRSYLADGTLVQVSEGSTTRLYLGDMVFNQVSGTISLESAAWDGGLLLHGSGTDKVLYYVTDHLGSVRVVKDGSGNIRQRYDYYPYGSVTRSWTSSNTSTPDKRYRFSGKEIAGTALGSLSSGADKYLDFGARLYSPGTAMWLSQDPLAESYYRFTPYLYCAGSPGNVVDPEGLSWYYSIVNGSFIEHIDDEDDKIYMLSQEQIDAASGNLDMLQSYRNDNNLFGQLADNGEIDSSIAKNVLTDLFNRANRKTEEGKESIISPLNIVIKNAENPIDEASSTSRELYAFLKSGAYYSGYDIINLFAHEIGHVVQRKQVNDNNRFKELPERRKEFFADKYSIDHWSYAKTSQHRKDKITQHIDYYKKRQ